MKSGFVLIAVLLLTRSIVFSTDVYYSDKRVVSANGKYAIEGKSPDNKKGNGRIPFAKSFEYVFVDLYSKKVLWRRKQKVREGSCNGLYVDNDGWVVIHTGWDELIFVSPLGQELGKIDILKDGLSKNEQKKYVQDTTAGPIWEGYSIWYFVYIDKRRFFVIRPWWGKRVIADVEKGCLIVEDASIRKACTAYEKAYVLRALERGDKTRKEWETTEFCRDVGLVLDAAYLAGKLHIKEAVPFLQKIQNSSYRGASAIGSGLYEPAEGEVDPAQWEELTVRQVCHLSLRRLGVVPAQYGCTKLGIYSKKNYGWRTYTLASLKYKRASRADEINKGMKPKEVLEIIGAPDFIDYGEWSYDMDTENPYTLIMKWGKKGIKSINKIRPPLWNGDKWDCKICQ